MAHIKLTLDKFMIIKQEDWFGKDEPYIWGFGILFDKERYRSREYIFTQSNIQQNNLRPGGVKAADTISIPSRVGKIIDEDVEPFFNKIIFVGLVLICWEQDFSKPNRMKIIHEKIANMLNNEIADVIDDKINRGDITPPTSDEIDTIKRKITEMVMEQRGEQRKEDHILDVDDYIGSGKVVYKISPLDKEFSTPLIFTCNRDGASYTVQGTIDYTP